MVIALGACRMHGDADQPPPVAKGAGQLELGLPIGSAQWREGRIVYRVQPRDYDRSARGEIDIIVDPATGSMLELDHVEQLELTAKHAIADRDGVVAIYDLATGATVGEPSHLTGAFVLAPDGRVAWAEPVSGELRIHLRVPGGAETVLTGLPDGKDPKIRFAGTRVIAATGDGLRVWDKDQLIVSRDEPMQYEPTIGERDLAYPAAVDDDHQALRVIDLDSHAPVTLHADGRCGAGAMSPFSSLRYCGERTFLVETGTTFCVWNAATGRVQARFSPARDEYHCAMDLAWVGDTPPGGPYDFYSTRTGKPVRPPHELPDEPDGDDHSSAPDQRPDADVAATIKDGAALAMAGGLIAGTQHDRAALWTQENAFLKWLGPAPSEAAAAAFAPDGTLAVVGRAGEVWHVDLASHAFRTGLLSGCTLDDVDPVVAAPDGKVAAACQRHDGRALVVEGTGTVFQGTDYGWYITAAATAKLARIGWLSYDGIHEWSLPDRQSRLTFDPAHYGLAFTADASRFATAAPIEDPRSYIHRYTVTVRDAKNTPLGSTTVDAEPGVLELSPDGAHLAISLADKTVIVIDATTGAVVDQLEADTSTDWTRAPLVAWDPVHPAHLAYYRGDPARIVIRDVASKKELETRAMLRPASGRIRGITWSLDGTRLALVADQLVTVWDGAARPVTLAFTGGGGVLWRADGSALVLGDPVAARSLLVCRRGTQTFTSLDGCESRVELARPLPLQTSTRP